MITNKPLLLLLRCFGFCRPAPKTRFERGLRRAEPVVLAVLLLYAALQAFPQVLFAHSLTAQGITFYSRTPVPPEAASCAAGARVLLHQSELAAPDRQERIFVCNSPWLFRLLAPEAADGFALSAFPTNNVFIAQADFERNVARSSAPIYNTRTLSSVAAHEITHGLIRRRLGLVRGFLLPSWAAEGYCDYVAKESSFPMAKGLRLMTSGQIDPSPAFRYFEDRQMVRYLIDDRHLSFAQVVSRARDYDAVKAETQNWLQTQLHE